MGISLTDQTTDLLLSCGFGVLLGAYFELFRLFRLFFSRSKAAVFFQDVVFFVTAAVFSFLLMLRINDGEVRGFLLLGELIGFSLYRATLGRLLFGIARRCGGVLERGRARFRRAFFLPVKAKCVRTIKKWAFGTKNLFRIRKKQENTENPT